jgi:hypothetical protein
MRMDVEHIYIPVNNHFYKAYCKAHTSVAKGEAVCFTTEVTSDNVPIVTTM